MVLTLTGPTDTVTVSDTFAGVTYGEGGFGGGGFSGELVTTATEVSAPPDVVAVEEPDTIGLLVSTGPTAEVAVEDNEGFVYGAVYGEEGYGGNDALAAGTIASAPPDVIAVTGQLGTAGISVIGPSETVVVEDNEGFVYGAVYGEEGYGGNDALDASTAASAPPDVVGIVEVEGALATVSGSLVGPTPVVAVAEPDGNVAASASSTGPTAVVSVGTPTGTPTATAKSTSTTDTIAVVSNNGGATLGGLIALTGEPSVVSVTAPTGEATNPIDVTAPTSTVTVTGPAGRVVVPTDLRSPIVLAASYHPTITLTASFTPTTRLKASFPMGESNQDFRTVAHDDDAVEFDVNLDDPRAPDDLSGAIAEWTASTVQGGAAVLEHTHADVTLSLDASTDTAILEIGGDATADLGGGVYHHELDVIGDNGDGRRHTSADGTWAVKRATTPPPE